MSVEHNVRIGIAPAFHEAPARVDFSVVKKRQQATWASGDFAVIGTTLQIVGEQLAEAANVRAGDYVVDVAAGNGNATLAAARRFARVVSTDYVPQLLERGAQRAKAEGLEIHFQRADAEALPFEDATFDVALSTFGAMFTPDHAKASRELRACCATPILSIALEAGYRSDAALIRGFDREFGTTPARWRRTGPPRV